MVRSSPRPGGRNYPGIPRQQRVAALPLWGRPLSCLRTGKGAVAGSQRGSHPGERLPSRADGYGQAIGDHASLRTDPDNPERLTGIYGSEGWGFESLRARAGQTSFVKGGPGSSQAFSLLRDSHGVRGR
jgi:hypothetical protein